MFGIAGTHLAGSGLTAGTALFGRQSGQTEVPIPLLDAGPRRGRLAAIRRRSEERLLVNVLQAWLHGQERRVCAVPSWCLGQRAHQRRVLAERPGMRCLAVFDGQTGSSGLNGQNHRSILLWDPGFARILVNVANPAERPGTGPFPPGWPTNSTHPAPFLERGVHGGTETPSPCKYGMLFTRIRETCFGRNRSMKPRGSRGGFRFPAPWLWPFRAITGHYWPYGQNPSPILLWDPATERYDVLSDVVTALSRRYGDRPRGLI